MQLYALQEDVECPWAARPPPRACSRRQGRRPAHVLDDGVEARPQGDALPERIREREPHDVLGEHVEKCKPARRSAARRRRAWAARRLSGGCPPGTKPCLLPPLPPRRRVHGQRDVFHQNAEDPVHVLHMDAEALEAAAACRGPVATRSRCGPRRCRWARPMNRRCQSRPTAVVTTRRRNHGATTS